MRLWTINIGHGQVAHKILHFHSGVSGSHLSRISNGYKGITHKGVKEPHDTVLRRLVLPIGLRCECHLLCLQPLEVLPGKICPGWALRGSHGSAAR